MSALFGLAIIWWGLIGLAGFLLGVYAIGLKMGQLSGWNSDHLQGRKAWLVKHFGEEGCRKWLANEKADKAGKPAVHGYSRPTMAEWNVKAKWYGAATVQAPWGTYYWPDRFFAPNLNDIHAAGMVAEWEQQGYWTAERIRDRADSYRAVIAKSYRDGGYTSSDGRELFAPALLTGTLYADPDQPFEGAGRIRVEEARKVRAFERDEVNNKITGYQTGFVQVDDRKYLRGKRFAFGWYKEFSDSGMLRRAEKGEMDWFDMFPYGVPDVHGVVDGEGSWVEIPLSEYEQICFDSNYIQSVLYMQRRQRARMECRWVKVEDFERVVRARAVEFNRDCPFETEGTADDTDWAKECRRILQEIKA